MSSIWYKRLAANDTGSSPGNMSGFLVPKALRSIFPNLDPPSAASADAATVIRAELYVDGEFRGEATASYQYQTWAGSRSAEYRVTRDLEPLLGEAKAGDILTIEILNPGSAYRLELLPIGTDAFKTASARRVNRGGRRGDWGQLGGAPKAKAAVAPLSIPPLVDPLTPPPIFATLTHGFDPEAWAAFGFANEKTRSKLASELRAEGGLLLSIGTMGEETPEHLRGRLLALHRLGTRPIATGELVEPEHWAAHLASNGGAPRWPYGLPILAAERFIAPLQARSDLLPRLHSDNLHQKLASSFERLKSEEAAAVLSLPRVPVTNLWRTRALDFAAGLIKPPAGPKPSSGTRILSTISGPAATYSFELKGPAFAEVGSRVAPRNSGKFVFKIGFSNNPERRLRELNAHLPDPTRLSWTYRSMQWHADEINAWAMEQAVFKELQADSTAWIRGEIYSVTSIALDLAWAAALRTAQRPEVAVEVQDRSAISFPADLDLGLSSSQDLVNVA